MPSVFMGCAENGVSKLVILTSTFFTVSDSAVNDLKTMFSRF